MTRTTVSPITRTTRVLEDYKNPLPLTRSERLMVWTGTVLLGIGIGTVINWTATVITWVIV